MFVKIAHEDRTPGVIRRALQLVALALVVVVVAIACGDDPPTGPTNTTPPTPMVTSEFTGTINTNGAFTHPFDAGRAGTLTATLTELDPEITIGFGVGSINVSGACSVTLARDQAVKSTVILGNINGSGTLCVRIYDVGNVTAPVTYKILVEYPQ